MDRVGRRVMFLGTMVMFIVFALAQSFAPNMETLAVIRLLLGIPLGADIAVGYTYIMESLPAGKREAMGNRWQAMFAIGEVAAILVITAMFAAGVMSEVLWRAALGLGAVPAIVLLLLRFNLPETAIWLIQKGRFREAKRVTNELYADNLDMLPDTDVDMPTGDVGGFFHVVFSDPIKRRATVFAWIASWAQALEFSTFAFYLPILFVLLGVSGILMSNLLTLAIYCIAIVSGLVGPQIVHRIAQRNLSIYGFGIVFISSMVALPRHRGIASGFSYIHTKLPQFLGIFLVPGVFQCDRSVDGDVCYRDIPTGRIARGDHYPAGGVRLRGSADGARGHAAPGGGGGSTGDGGGLDGTRGRR